MGAPKVVQLAACVVLCSGSKGTVQHSNGNEKELTLSCLNTKVQYRGQSI